MKYEYARTASCSYMVVREAEFSYADYQIKMLTCNRIPGLLDIKVIMENGKPEYWYDITGLQPFAGKAGQDKVTWDMLCMLIRNICDMKMALEKYLLDADDLVYRENYLFRDRKTEKLMFCYVPGLKGEQENGLLTMMEGILERLDHSDPRTVRAAYEIYEACASGEAGVEKLMQCISQATPGPMPGAQSALPIHFPPEPEIPKPMQVREEAVFPMPSEKQRGRMPFLSKIKKRKEQESDDWTEDDFLEMKEIGRWGQEQSVSPKKVPVWASGAERPTEMISQAAVRQGLWLLYKGEGKEHDLYPEAFPFLIGKKEGGADGILSAKTVSRVHARIYREGNGYYLEDENSTNGTYVNGELLPCHTPYPIRSGDRILFGNEAFQAALIP